MNVLKYKHGSLWDIEDLFGFNIHIKDVDDVCFFDHKVDEVDTSDIARGLIKEEGDLTDFGTRVIQYASSMIESVELTEDDDDYIIYLLKIMGFDNVQTKENISMAIKDDVIELNTDVVLRDRENDYIRLIIQHNMMDDKIVQRMIAVHQVNEYEEEEEEEEEKEYEKKGEEIFAVCMMNALPIFYKAKISSELQYGIVENIRPESHTIVYKFDPFVNERESQSISNHEMRKRVLQCFKLLMKTI